MTRSRDGTAMAFPSGRQNLRIPHPWWATAIAMAKDRDGTLLGLVGSGEGTVTVCDLETPAFRHYLPGQGGADVVAAAVARNGDPLALAEAGKAVNVWDLTTGTRRHVLAGHTGNVTEISALSSQDGVAFALTAGFDRTAVIWDLDTGEEVLRWHLPDQPAFVTAAGTASWSATVERWPTSGRRHELPPTPSRRRRGSLPRPAPRLHQRRAWHFWREGLTRENPDRVVRWAARRGGLRGFVLPEAPLMVRAPCGGEASWSS